VWEFLSFKINDVSVLTLHEYAVLIASLESSFEPKKFNCRKCITQYGRSKRLQDKTLVKRKGKGCFDFVTKSYKIENVVFKSCVGNFTSNINYLFDVIKEIAYQTVEELKSAFAEKQ